MPSRPVAHTRHRRRAPHPGAEALRILFLRQTQSCVNTVAQMVKNGRRAALLLKLAQTLAQQRHRVPSQVLLEQPPFPLLSAPAQLAALARLPISTARLLTRPPSRCCISPPTHQTPRISPCTVLASVIILASFYNQPFPASFCQLFQT